MSRRKRKIFYSVSNYSNLFWCPKYHKWIKLDEGDGFSHISSHRSFRTFRKAWRHLQALPKDFYILRYLSKKGRREIREIWRKS